jgi:tetratricopeptide (TPR) repeat protein
MAEHNGGNRGGNDRGPFRGTNNSGGEPRGFRSRDDRNSEGPKGGSGSGDRKSFGERKPYGDRDNKPYGDRPRREGDSDRRSFGGGERKPFSGGGERKPYGDRDNKPYGDRPRREGDSERRGFSGGDNRKPFGDRQDRAPRSFDRGDSGPRQFGRDRAEDRPARVPNARDLRSANRPDRERSPEIDEDVTGKELDRATQHQIKTLEAKSAEWVARHLVMAGRLIDEEPELAFQHALAASRRGGRLAAVREAVGLTAYAAGHYGEALREFRTYRRISGSNVHLPVMADCERGLGRPDRALDVVRSEEANDLDAPGKAELAIVAAGARTDLGQLDAAVAELEIAQLDINRAFSYSPRLFRAYGDALAAVGRQEEAAKWQKQAVVAENALGLGVDEEPDIVDLGWDEEEEAREEAQRRRLMERAAGATEAESAGSTARTETAAETAERTAASTGVEAAIDDVESDYFESDDAESDEDSVESDELESGASEEPASNHEDSVHEADADAGDFDGGNAADAGHSERQDS